MKNIIKRKSKYGNKRTIIKGIEFHSKKEGFRYLELCSLVKSGNIKDLRLQVKYEFEKNGRVFSSYKADFVYFDIKKGVYIVEDVKGYRTDMYRLKKNMMKVFHDIDILET